MQLIKAIINFFRFSEAQIAEADHYGPVWCGSNKKHFGHYYKDSARNVFFCAGKKTRKRVRQFFKKGPQK